MPAVGEKARLKIEHKREPGGCLIKLTGSIDETFDREAMVRDVTGVVVIDLNEVRRITSYGVRGWVNALQGLTAEYLCFVNCRPSVVSQFNMVNGFGAKGQVLSFYAPFVCTACQEDVDQLYDLRRQFTEVQGILVSRKVEPIKCPKCGEEARFDDVPSAYLKFLTGLPPPSPPPLVDALLGSGAAAAGLTIEKEVAGNITALWLRGALDEAVHFRRVADGLEGKGVVVADGVEGIKPKGAQQLIRLLESPEVELQLARAPLRLVEELKQARWGRTPISALLEARCVSCANGARVELTHLEVSQLGAAGETRAPCPRCGGPLKLLDVARAQAALTNPPLAEVPAELANYLADSPHPPSGRRPVAAPSAVALAGSTFGRYHITRSIGGGGMAEVFLARQTGIGGFDKKVALKLILPNLSADEGFISMFLQEARLSARLSHPNVVQVLDVGEVATRYFIAMEYVSGTDLAAALRIAARLNQPLPVGVACRIVADVCAGLHAAHTSVGDDGSPRPIIHRDVSPHNVLLSDTGQVKLTDFGIAKAADSAQLTPTSGFKGKLSYMAPEQLKAGGGSIDPRLDIFPTGVMLYQCLTLNQPFRKENELATLQAIMTLEVPPPSTVRADVPVELDEIVARALARDPAQRYATAEEFHERLETHVARQGEPVSAVQVSQWLRRLVDAAVATGVLGSEMARLSFTPTADRPSQDATRSVAGPAGRATNHEKK